VAKELLLAEDYNQFKKDVMCTPWSGVHLMDIKDIDIFIKAKRMTRIPNLILGIAYLLLWVFLGLEIAGIEHGYRVAIVSWVVALIGMAFGSQKWAFVPREKLIDIIERQINSDADAIEYMARKESKGSE
jgi:hypothetical protein